jgi:arginyl-tRNA--protein-N-Asp/Glu arginylyltransferase
VYNEVNKEKDEAMKEVFKSYRELETAIKEGKSEKEINTLLDKYLAAQKVQKEVDAKAAEKYRKVLKGDKVAKVFIAEENFRRHHIRNLHGKPGGHQQPQAKR